MFRPETKRDKAKEQAKTHQKQESQWQADKSKYLKSDFTYRDNSKQAVESYQKQERMRKLDEEDEKLDMEQELKKQQERQQQIDKIKQSGSEGITAAEYYDKAIALRDGNGEYLVNKPLAAQTFWKALICGEDKAAFDLFQMLYNGDGIAQNQELARPLWSVANRFDDQRAAPYKGKIGLTPTLSSIGGSMFAACKKAETDFTVISPEALDFQITAFNAIMNTDKLTTDFAHHTMPDYLVPMDELPHDEVVVTGDSSSSHCCIIL